MNIVLYTNDFEPITVLDLPIWLLEQLEKQGSVRVAVMEPPTWTTGEHSSIEDNFKTVVIHCEKLRWRDNTTKPILVTSDEDLALMLKPEWLPGQRQAINAYKQTIRVLTDNLVKAMRK